MANTLPRTGGNADQGAPHEMRGDPHPFNPPEIMTNTLQAQTAVAHFQGCVAKLATVNEGVKSVGAGMKSLVALLDLINSPSPEIPDQLRLQLSASALRISRRVLTESHTAHKQMLAQLRALDELNVVDRGAAEAVADAEQGEVSRHD